MGEMTDILIIGGGLNGPVLALAAAQGGLSVRVVDAAPAETHQNPDFDGRAYALALASGRMLAALGIWDRVGPQAQPINDIKVSDGVAGQGAAPWFLHFDHREIAEGPMGHLVEDRYLRHALLDLTAAEDRIAFESNAQVVDHTPIPGGVQVTLASGETRDARLIIAADGRNSGTAARAGIGRTGWGYGQTSLVASLETERPHHGIAHQMFFPEGPLAILPLPGNRVSIVWTEDQTRAAQINDLPDPEYLAMLRPRFGNFLGDIKLVGERYTYPLSLSLANRLVADRLALVGDAAHGIHPLAGQGLNLGLRDVAALAEVLVTARRRGEDIGASDVLERYRQWRQFDIAALAAGTDLINRSFSNANPLLRLGRTLALGALNSLPAARRALIHEATGLTGDLPRLLQGRPI